MFPDPTEPLCFDVRRQLSKRQSDPKQPAQKTQPIRHKNKQQNNLQQRTKTRHAIRTLARRLSMHLPELR
jgi:hypothetical protein